MRKSAWTKLVGLLLAGGLAALAAGGCAGSTANKSTAPAPEKPGFPNKDITFIVPVKPGGGYDTNARILAPFLKKYLPGQPNVIVENVPGGEWRLGIMKLVKAPPDGHSICIFNIPGNVMGQITGQAEYDLNKVCWIGRITDTCYVTALSPKSKFRTLEDLRKAPSVKSGVVGLTSSSALAVIISAKEMGYQLKTINHDGSTEAAMSCIRGDVDLVTYPFPTLKELVVGGKDLIPFAVYSKTRLKDLPDTPTIGELGFEKLLDVVCMDYMVGTTPGTPDDILRVWRDAFDKAVKDPEFLKLMEEQLKAPPNPLNGEEAAKRVSDSLSVYQQYKDLVMEYMPK